MPYGYTPPSPRAPWGPGVDPFGKEAPPWTPPREAPPSPARKERKYEPLPGFGWEFPWQVEEPL